MQIKNHRLVMDNGTPVEFISIPNKGGTYMPIYLVMHYTAVTTFDSTSSWFQNPNAKASAHLLVGRDGKVTQFVPFNVVAWHAGKSQWKGMTGLNQFSIGIEMVNGGRLAKSGDKWFCPVDQRKVPDTEVVMAVHKNETAQSAWQEYTDEQLKVAIEIGALLAKTYGLKDVVGHEDIAPIRKSDPGPAFPMSSFRAKIMGRQNETLDEFKTSTILNIRSGPGTNFAPLTEPMPANIHVLVLKSEGTWSFVEVLEPLHGIVDLEGWVSTKFLVEI